MEEAICVELRRPSVLCLWQMISFICRPALLSWPDVTPERRKRQSTQTAFDLMPQHFLFLDLPDYQTVLVFEISLLYVSWKRSLLCCVFVVRSSMWREFHIDASSWSPAYWRPMWDWPFPCMSLLVVSLGLGPGHSFTPIKHQKGPVFSFLFLYINIVQQNRGCSVLCWKKLF